MIAVLVASADDRRDIFDTCFAHSDRIWAAWPWSRYVGFNTPGPDLYGFKVVTAPPDNNWCKQVASYIDAMPNNIRYVLLMVEDALFMAPINHQLIQTVMDAVHAQHSYARMVPVSRNLLGKISETYRMLLDIGLFHKIKKSEPYYCSTEMALWRRDYLRQLLDYKNDAWSFEHMVTGIDHYAVHSSVVQQHQIVNKGRWTYEAPRLLKRMGLTIKGNRPFQTRGAYLRGWRSWLSFQLFGFISFRIRRKFR